MTDRIHRFDALDNFRDYGDYAAGDRHIARGRLFRSAHQARVSDADLDRLSALGIGTIVDLRRPGERRDQPSRRPASWNGQVLASDLGPDGEAPHITFLRTADLTVNAGRTFMTGVYARLAFEPAHLDLFARYFRALGDADGAALIHCAAGKDRTGTLAALTHHLLGVHRDDMVADYLLTNTAVDLEALAPRVARQLQQMTGRTPAHDAVVAFLGVEPVYLETALAEIETRHGSIDAYLEQALGVDTALRDRIIARLAA